jgi:hypothetical protein
MQLLIDESRNFTFPTTTDQSVKLSVIVGVVLPYKAKEKFLKKYSILPKTSTQKDDLKIANILEDLILWKVKAILVIADHSGMVQGKMEKYREDLLQQIENYINQNPLPIDNDIQNSLNQNAHNNLMLAKQLTLQEFTKMIALCECCASFLELFFSNANHLRAIDIRKRALIIDDQTSRVRNLLMNFFWIYVWIESKQGRFNSIPSESLKEISQFIREEKNIKYVNTPHILKKHLIGDNGNPKNFKLDDKYPELKAADFCANVLQKVLNGTITSEDIITKLKEILIINTMFHFHENIDDWGGIYKLARTLFKN